MLHELSEAFHLQLDTSNITTTNRVISLPYINILFTPHYIQTVKLLLYYPSPLKHYLTFKYCATKTKLFPVVIYDSTWNYEQTVFRTFSNHSTKSFWRHWDRKLWITGQKHQVIKCQLYVTGQTRCLSLDCYQLSYDLGASDHKRPRPGDRNFSSWLSNWK